MHVHCHIQDFSAAKQKVCNDIVKKHKHRLTNMWDEYIRTKRRPLSKVPLPGPNESSYANYL